MDAFSYRHFRFCLEHGLIDRGQRILVQVSGGADSVCLALLIQHFLSKISLHPVWIHFNHGIRAASDHDEAFVGALAERFSVPLHIFRNQGQFQPKNFQSEARNWRLRTVTETASKLNIDRIMTGHQMDDVIETFFWRLSRGTSLFGLSIMKPLDQLKARPLIYTEKSEIVSYLRAINQSWCEDESNRKNTYTRNKIRNELLPNVSHLLGEAYRQKIVDLVKEAAELEQLLSTEMLTLYRQAQLPYSALNKIPRLLMREVIVRWLENAGLYDIQRKKIDRLCDAVMNNQGNITVELTGKAVVRAANKMLTIVR